MAKKTILKIKGKEGHSEYYDGYKYNDFLGLALMGDTWQAVHIPTGCVIVGKDAKFKRKRSCLKYVEMLEHLDFDIQNTEELYAKNGGKESIWKAYDIAYNEGVKLE